MKQFLLFAFLLLTVSSSFGQSNIYLKVYQNSDFYKRSENFYNIELREQIVQDNFISSFNRISLGLGIEPSKLWYHELEFSYSQDIPPIEHMARIDMNSQHKSQFYSIQYEIDRIITNNESFRLETGIGFNPYFAKTKSIPQVPTTYPITDKNTGAGLFLIPRFSFHLSSKLNLELSSKLGLLNINHYESIVHNPAVPPEQQRWEDNIKWTFFPFAYNLRIGLAYKIKDSNIL